MGKNFEIELQRAREVFDLLDAALPKELRGLFGKGENKGRIDPHLFPDPPKPAVFAKLRVLPNRRNVPEKFWDPAWCFYEVGVGVRTASDWSALRNNHMSVAHVMFFQAQGNKECGQGVHTTAVKRILADACVNLKALGFQDASYPTPKGEYSFLARLYKGSSAYQSSGHFPPPDEIARDLALLIAHTYPAFVDYAKSASR